jgi:hypothetical protein
MSALCELKAMIFNPGWAFSGGKRKHHKGYVKTFHRVYKFEEEKSYFILNTE